MQYSDTQDEDEDKDSGFNLGGFIRDRLLLRAVFGGDAEEPEPAPVIQIDSGSAAPEEEVEAKDTSQDDAPPEAAAAEEPVEEVPAS